MLSHQYQRPVPFNDPAPKVSFDLITGQMPKLVTASTGA